MVEKRKTSVKKHSRKIKSGKKTSVKKHTRKLNPLDIEKRFNEANLRINWNNPKGETPKNISEEVSELLDEYTRGEILVNIRDISKDIYSRNRESYINLNDVFQSIKTEIGRRAISESANGVYDIKNTYYDNPGNFNANKMYYITKAGIAKSSRRYEGYEKLPKIGEEINVNYIIKGKDVKRKAKVRNLDYSSDTPFVYVKVPETNRESSFNLRSTGKSAYTYY